MTGLNMLLRRRECLDKIVTPSREFAQLGKPEIVLYR